MNFLADTAGILVIPAFPSTSDNQFMRVTDWQLVPEARVVDCLKSADTLVEELSGIFPDMPSIYFTNLVRLCALACSTLPIDARVQTQIAQDRLVLSLPETGAFITLSDKPLQGPNTHV